MQMKNNVQTFVIALALSLLVAGAAGAQATSPEQFGTPDNMPPSMEDVCDETTGKANGLCVAYCEAMDCDSDNPNANENACTKVGENFVRITGELPPCERICPCWEEAELESVTAENQFVPGLFSCVSGAFATPDGVLIQNDGSLPGVQGGFATGDLAPGVRGCFTRDLPPFALEITEDEFSVCNAQIEARCEAIGTPIP